MRRGGSESVTEWIDRVADRYPYQTIWLVLTVCAVLTALVGREA